MKNIVVTEDHGIEIPPAVIKKQKIYDKAEDKNVAAVMIFDGGDDKFYYEESCINEVPTNAFLNLFEKGVIIKKPDGSRVTPDGIDENGAFIFSSGGGSSEVITLCLTPEDITANALGDVTIIDDSTKEMIYDTVASARETKAPLYLDLSVDTPNREGEVTSITGYLNILTDGSSVTAMMALIDSGVGIVTQLAQGTKVVLIQLNNVFPK